MKKRILFCFTSFQVGGVACSLMNLINVIHDKYEIDLLCFSNEGTLKEQVPDNVHILPTTQWAAMLGDTQKLTIKKSRWRGFIRGLFMLYSRTIGSKVPMRLVLKTLPKLPHYDVAISFTHDPHFHVFAGGCNRYIIENVDADIKATFVHCDYSRYGGNTQESRDLYAKFDYIACCSEGCKRIFDETVPALVNKTIVVRNCFQYEDIEQKATLFNADFDKDFFNIVTVCRLSPEKGLDKAMRTISEIHKKCPKVRWHIVGDGAEYQKLKELQESMGMQDVVLFWGEQKNPYPYIKAANLFFLPSEHECAPMVFNESWAVGTPVLCTRTISVKEMIEEPQVGLVCEHTVDSMIEKLDYLLTHLDQLDEYRRNMDRQPQSNVKAEKEFEKLVKAI